MNPTECLPQNLLLAIVLATFAVAARAEEPRRLAHYSHQRWIEGSEAPAPVKAMAQGKDGFLWLATGEGLFRFDGTRFERIEPEDHPRKHDQPSALLITRSGEVWTNFETSHRFAVYRHGVLRVLDAPPAPSRIVMMSEGIDGSIWALTANYDAEVLRFHDGRWRTYDVADGLPQNNATNMLVAADGTLWIACGGSVVRLLPGAKRFEIASDAIDGRVSLDPAGRVWVSEQHGTYPLTGPGGLGSPIALPAPYNTGDAQIRGTPLLDREGNLWIATRYQGLRRLAIRGASFENVNLQAESFTSRDGLSSDVTNQIIEDREGNIWIGTESGLDKFRPATLIAEPVLGSPAAYGDKLLEASDGSVYVGQARTIYRARPGGDLQPLLNTSAEPQSLCEGPDGAIWIGFQSRIMVWSNGKTLKTIERPDKSATHNIIYDCTFDAQGNYWISAAGGGVHRYRGSGWETVVQAGDQADFFPTTMVRSPRGGVVVQKGDRLLWIEGSQRTSTQLDFRGSALKVLTLYASGDSLFAAGAFGLSRFRDAKIETAWASEASASSRINGIVRTPGGAVWLAYPDSIVRMDSADLERAFSRQSFPVPALSLGRGDGLSSRPHSHSQRSMVRGGDGRLWIATETGTLWMDPAHIVRNTLPPGLAIKSLTADGRVFRDPTSLRLMAATANIEIDFAALSFSDPGRVLVRYKLEGSDRDWVDPGRRRQAFYTNLPPGQYKFRVIAANNDGVWNRTGAALEFTIPPTFVQSAWFKLLCSVLVLFAIWLSYRLRVAQIAQRIRSRLEERIKERERIARELHDTLLQGIQGLILRFQAVAERIPVEDKSRDQLEAALVAADDVIVEARSRVRELRGDEANGDLCAMIEQMVPSVPFDPPIPVRIVVEGRSRALDPVVAAEITRIVRESLFNIAHHAHASGADITVAFEPRYLAVRTRDDGVGIAGHVLARGYKDGHFGMVGMRERTEKIGGDITISSSPRGGTEVMLSVPAELAFPKSRSRRGVGLPKILKRNPNNE